MVKIVELLIRENLPQKDFFHASEVATLLNVTPQEIGYWESQFPQIRMHRTKTGQRIYRREDVLQLMAIKHLLLEKKLSMAAIAQILSQGDERVVFAVGDEEDIPVPWETASPLVREPSAEVDGIIPETPVSEPHHDQVLINASHLLDSSDYEDEFDGLTHQLYQRYRDDLAEVKLEVEPLHVGEMLKDALEQKTRADDNVHRLAKLEFEKAKALLLQSKESLTQLLVALEQFRESDFFDSFQNDAKRPMPHYQTLGRG